jgi:hypothetical protein
MKYQDFLKTKQKKIEKSGFKPKKLNSHLFDFQKFIVERALEAGRYAVSARS